MVRATSPAVVTATGNTFKNGWASVCNGGPCQRGCHLAMDHPVPEPGRQSYAHDSAACRRVPCTRKAALRRRRRAACPEPSGHRRQLRHRHLSGNQRWHGSKLRAVGIIHGDRGFDRFQRLHFYVMQLGLVMHADAAPHDDGRLRPSVPGAGQPAWGEWVISLAASPLGNAPGERGARRGET